jgi:hypothetical protein
MRANATRNNQSSQLVELASLEIRRRELLRDLALVEAETHRLNREIRVLGIEIPWLPHGTRRDAEVRK